MFVYYFVYNDPHELNKIKMNKHIFSVHKKLI